MPPTTPPVVAVPSAVVLAAASPDMTCLLFLEALEKMSTSCTRVFSSERKVNENYATGNILCEYYLTYHEIAVVIGLC